RVGAGVGPPPVPARALRGLRGSPRALPPAVGLAENEAYCYSHRVGANMGSIGAPEILVVALIALLLFGAGRIADIGKGLGQGIKNFKQGIKEADSDEEEED